MSRLPLTFHASSITIERVVVLVRFFQFLIFLPVALLASGCPRRSAVSPVAPAPAQTGEPSGEMGTQLPGPTEPITVPALGLRPLVRQIAPLKTGDLLIPGGGESVRYPKDFAIGELGQGGADKQAYDAASTFLLAFIAESLGSPASELDVFKLDAPLVRLLKSITPHTARISSGTGGPGGEYSFLVRFIGPELSATGELYLVKKDDDWLVEDLRMDEPSSERYDPFTYTRFF